MSFAQWLTGPENPLTARVAVNRMWQEFFGRGIVRTSEDFGTQGEKPTHPELLDWLASEFRDTGWSMKRMHRLIVTSAAYRQSSKVRPELKERDPENTLISRQSRSAASGGVGSRCSARVERTVEHSDRRTERRLRSRRGRGTGIRQQRQVGREHRAPTGTAAACTSTSSARRRIRS